MLVCNRVYVVAVKGGIRIALQWKNQQYRWPGQGNFFKVMKINITQSLERAGQQHTDSFPQLPLVLRYKRQYETEGMSSEHWKILLLFLTSSKLWCKWLLHLSFPGHCVPVNEREGLQATIRSSWLENEAIAWGFPLPTMLSLTFI